MRQLFKTTSGNKVLLDLNNADAIEEVNAPDEKGPGEVHVTIGGTLHKLHSKEPIEDLDTK